MIRMIQSKSAGQAKAYFRDALSKSDYYISDQEYPGYWQGRLAVRLGLEGSTEKEDFFALCENKIPRTGDALTPRNVEERTVGYDINFHCPKSVSVLHALTEDQDILKVFRESVTATMQAIEDDGQTRVRLGGKYENRQTAEMVWAHFVHQTARPVEGALPDPHLHSHCYVFNATWDETENRIKAGQFRDIKRDMPYYQAMFQKTLSDKLIDIGYDIHKTDKSFEIAGVPQKVLDLFSKRTDEIGRIAKEQGITDAKQLDELGARTRAQKQKGRSMEELKEEWLKQIDALGDEGKSTETVRYAPSRDIVKLSAGQCVDYALHHSFERYSVVADRRLLASAYTHGIGTNTVNVLEINQQFEKDDRLIRIFEKGQSKCTTRTVLGEEKHMVDMARQGLGKNLPAYEKAPELSLMGQQAAAVEHVLTTSNRVSIIRGAAGTGKTTLMKEAVEKFNEAGKAVFVVAPTAQASRGVLKEEEGFDNAETVAKFLSDPKMQDSVKGEVLMVDEAGLLGTKDMIGLLEFANNNNTQLILIGDTRQHSSVVRGDALRILNTVAKVEVAEVSKIRRQTNKEYREAVEDLSEGKVKEAFEKLDNIGFIKEVDQMKPSEALVEDYIATLKKGKSALVISPTHAQGEDATVQIRKRMREEGLIGKKEITAMQLKKLNMTEAEKADTRNFKDGQVVKFTQNLKGIQRGSLWTVETTPEKGMHLKNSTGETRAIPTDKSKRYEVFKQQEIALSKGDKVLVNNNSFDVDKKRIDNGTILEVTAVTKGGAISLKNAKSERTFMIDKNFGHLAHAHCITSHASQGKTIDEVFIYQPAATFPATDARQFYVSVSRGKTRAHVYTDDKEALLQHAEGLGERQSAIELVASRHKDYIAHLQRQEIEQKFNKEKSRDYDPDR